MKPASRLNPTREVNENCKIVPTGKHMKKNPRTRQAMEIDVPNRHGKEHARRRETDIQVDSRATKIG